jgi:hypothetical protein
MTNTATKTYLVGVIERAIVYYKVEAEDARTAAENWLDGEFHDSDDEALESEGPCNVRKQQSDGTWTILPPSEWEAEPPAAVPLNKANARLATAAPTMLEALRLAQRALNTAPRFRVGVTDSYKIAAIVDKAIAEADAARREPL